MDWDDLWQGLCFLTFVALLGSVALLIFSPKNVDYYYLSRANSGNAPATCVYAHWTWHSDEVAFCTDDAQKALDFVAKANATVKK
jgi:hypothetical protein